MIVLDCTRENKMESVIYNLAFFFRGCKQSKSLHVFDTQKYKDLFNEQIILLHLTNYLG